MANIKDECNGLREEIKRLGDRVKGLHKHDVFDQEPAQHETDNPKADKPEMRSCVQLAYRHLEDARMRLGKVIQAFEGGVSVYDEPSQQQPS